MVIAGFVPLTVASIFYVAFWIGVAHPDQPWLAGQFPPGPAPFTLEDLRTFQQELATDFATGAQIEFANVMTSGFLIVMLALFGLRRFQRWAWYVILVVFLWAGLNDTVALLVAHEPPVPLVGEAVGLVGLVLARSAIFAKRDPPTF